MDVPEPEQTPFTAVTAQTSKLARVSFSMLIFNLFREVSEETRGGKRCAFVFKAQLLTCDGSVLAIPNLSRCLYAFHGIPLGRDCCPSPSLLLEDRYGSGMVHWYAIVQSENIENTYMLSYLSTYPPTYPLIASSIIG